MGDKIVRLRKKPWVEEALDTFSNLVFKNPGEELVGQWQEVFGRKAPLFVELGTGKGRFITELATRHQDINLVGIEAQQDVLYYAAKKVQERELTNVRLLVFDINNLLTIFAPGEVDRLYINFCDPWPKNRHAKRRLTHVNFLDKYAAILKPGGQLFFKTDNEELFAFSLEQFAERKLHLENVTHDLHNSDYQGNIMTEYEEKFSSKGMKIHRAEVTFPA